MIGDLGEWAESRFSTLCAARGVTRNKASQDRTGWDYLVEFSPNEIPGLPIDLQPASASARVQIKAQGRGRPHVSLKLSNALRFAKAAEPCFIVLFLATDGDEPCRIYAKHFWSDLIGKTLRRAREADSAGRTDVHRLSLPITFQSEDEHTEDLLGWMKREIDSVGGLYAEKKNILQQTIGMEDGGIHGTITIDTTDWGAIVDHQLGLRPDAPVIKFTVQQRRFGVDAATPMISFAPDTASMKPHPKPCRVRLRGKGTQDVWLEGDLVAPTFPDLPPEYFKLRVQADFLDLTSAFERGGDVTISWSAEDRRSLQSLRNALDVAQMLVAGPLDAQVRFKGQVVLAVGCNIQGADRYAWAPRISNGLKTLEAVAGRDVPPDLTLTVKEIDAAWDDIVELNGMIGGANFSSRLVFEGDIDTDLQADSFWTYGYADVGNWSFLAIVSRPVIRADVEGAVLNLVCGTPVLMEGLVRSGSGAEHLDELKRLYRSNVTFAGEGAIEIFDGNWRAMVSFLKENTERDDSQSTALS